jgi:hypothetical protein
MAFIFSDETWWRLRDRLRSIGMSLQDSVQLHADGSPAGRTISAVYETGTVLGRAEIAYPIGEPPRPSIRRWGKASGLVRGPGRDDHVAKALIEAMNILAEECKIPVDP